MPKLSSAQSSLPFISEGGWTDETLIEGMEDILSREMVGSRYVLQNELGLHGTEKALTFLLSLDAAYKLTAGGNYWLISPTLFPTGTCRSASDKKIQAGLEPEQMSLICRFGSGYLC